MAGIKRTYIANTGIDFEGGKVKRRVEAGDELPADISQSEIEDLLEISAIRVKDHESEGQQNDSSSGR
jgi:hypothetical protein